MSANPDAFTFLRHSAYDFAKKHGRDLAQLEAHCEQALADWRNGPGAGSGLTDAEADELVWAVSEWTAKTYQPPRKKAERDREQRALERRMAPALLEMVQEDGKPPTVRNAASISGLSKSTIARHLKSQGIAPRRQKKVEQLSPTAQRLLDLIEETLPRDTAGILSLDELGFALWDGLRRDLVKPFPSLPKSTLSKRRKTLKAHLEVLHKGGLGLSIMQSGDSVVVWQGRRIPPMKELAEWFDREMRRVGVLPVAIPRGSPADQQLFWEDPWLKAVLGTFQLALNPHIYDPMRLAPMLDLMRLKGGMLRDLTPVYRCAASAIGLRMTRYDFPERLCIVANQISAKEKELANIVSDIASKLEWLEQETRKHNPASDVIFVMEWQIRFMDALRDRFPDSYCRVRHVEQAIFADIENVWDAEPVWMSLAADERDGRWNPPDIAELRKWLPQDEIPF